MPEKFILQDVLESGGVDSSVAAWLLARAGPRGDRAVHAAWAQPPTTCLPRLAARRPRHKQGCCTAADAADARRVADMLGHPVLRGELRGRSSRRIVDYFVDEYTAGRTPNPCVVCNTWLKFGKLFEYADSVGAEFVATGHYARLGRPMTDGQVAPVPRPRRRRKDQSYVLFGIQRRLLPRLMFPGRRASQGGDPPDRRAAWAAAWRRSATARKSASCPTRTTPASSASTAADVDTSGEIVTTDGTVVGHHDGFEQFTVGQRKGLRHGLRRAALRGADRARDTARGDRHRRGTRPERTDRRGGPTGWSSRRGESLRAQVKIRYRSRPGRRPTVEPLAGRSVPRRASTSRATAIAPGQAAVCYQGDRVLGGGWIE